VVIASAGVAGAWLPPPLPLVALFISGLAVAAHPATIMQTIAHIADVIASIGRRPRLESAWICARFEAGAFRRELVSPSAAGVKAWLEVAACSFALWNLCANVPPSGRFGCGDTGAAGRAERLVNSLKMGPGGTPVPCLTLGTVNPVPNLRGFC